MSRIGLVVFGLILLAVFASFNSSVIGVGAGSVVSVDPGFRIVVVEVNETGVFEFKVSYSGPGIGFFVLSTNSSSSSVYPSSFSLLSGQTATVYVTDTRGSPGIYDVVLTVRELGSGESVNATARLAVASECIRGSTLGGVMVLVADSINVSVEINATGLTCAKLCVLPENPLPEYVPADSGSLSRYFDIYIGRPDRVEWPITVKMNYTEQEILDDNLDEVSLKLNYWNDTGLTTFADTGVHTSIRQVYAYPEENETQGSIVMAIAQLNVLPIPEPPVTSLVLALATISLMTILYWRKYF